jgi:vancomycin resistance protein YoaR
VEETVEKAWAIARGNTGSLRGSGVTPFQERVNEVSRLRSYPKTFVTVQDYDRKALRALTDGIVNYVNRDPVNSMVASFDFNTKAFTFTEDRPGAKLDPDQLYAQVAALLDDGITDRELRVVPEKILAEVTRTELQNRFGLISAYTTSTTNNKNRNTNIQLSAEAISGVTVLPGETFSFNKATGERTAEKGYKEAAAISGGATRDEIGGGVCQTSSTLFNAVVRADLEIVERHGHAWPSSYIEKGFDATVNWPGLDFQFRNNTDWPVFILANYANRKVTVNIYGMSLGADVRIDLESEVTRVLPQPEGTNYVVNTSLAPGESKKTVTGRQGYMVDTWKIWYQGSRETKREKLFTTTYKAYQETVEYNPR